MGKRFETITIGETYLGCVVSLAALLFVAVLYLFLGGLFGWL